MTDSEKHYAQLKRSFRSSGVLFLACQVNETCARESQHTIEDAEPESGLTLRDPCRIVHNDVTFRCWVRIRLLQSIEIHSCHFHLHEEIDFMRCILDHFHWIFNLFPLVELRIDLFLSRSKPYIFEFLCFRNVRKELSDIEVARHGFQSEEGMVPDIVGTKHVPVNGSLDLVVEIVNETFGCETVNGLVDELLESDLRLHVRNGVHLFFLELFEPSPCSEGDDFAIVIRIRPDTDAIIQIQHSIRIIVTKETDDVLEEGVSDPFERLCASLDSLYRDLAIDVLCQGLVET